MSDNTRAPAKPNVLFILTDDLGWQDVACYRVDEPTPYETPNMDALAKDGILFRQAYAPAPTCAPSRCAILSGDHPARAQLTCVSGGGPPRPWRKTTDRMMPPWYGGHMPVHKMTLPKALQANGYVTGHAGKWHIGPYSAENANAVGFDYSRSQRGATIPTPDRCKIFASHDPNDAYRLDANGYPQHDNFDDAMAFLKQQEAESERPFFLYWATWLVHAPIHTRARALLEKYCAKMGLPFPKDPGGIQALEDEGQKNPYYAAMVEMLDYYLGQLIRYLKETDDPRWPGHKLSENTYIIFTSDNGGMEIGNGERITDNYPLDRGKMSTREGGIKVPMLVTGPGIAMDQESDVPVNGLDLFPTLLSLTGTPKAPEKRFDGCDLSRLLLETPQDRELVRDDSGHVRDALIWHYPHGAHFSSAILMDGYKFIINYDYIDNPHGYQHYELFQLYNTEGDHCVRVNIEETDLVNEQQPERAQMMRERLETALTEMRASYPFNNPEFGGNSQGKETIPLVTGHVQEGNYVTFSYRENGATVVHADLIWTDNGGQPGEEWYRAPALLTAGNQAEAVLPEAATHYFINLVDENNFLVCNPRIHTEWSQRGGKPYSDDARPSEPVAQ